jgi:predicted dehydrogenase
MSGERTVGIALVGCGWMGELHAAAYLRVRRHYPECAARPRLVIAADEVRARADAAAERLGFAHATTDPFAAIRHPDVEAVSIATPNHMHLPLARAAASAGKPFWIEKPVGRFPAETELIAAAAADVVTTVGFNYRHAPVVDHARRLIADGELGDVRTYRGRFLVDYGSVPERALSWRFTREYAGLGVLGDLMSHAVDMAQHLVGPVTAVTGQREIDVARRPRATGAGQFSVAAGAELAPVENEDYAIALARLAGGARASFEVSRTMVGCHCEMAFEVHGTGGALAWDFQRMNELRRVDAGGWTTVYAAPEHGDFAHFQPDAGVGMGYDDLKVIEARTFLESVLDGRGRAPGVAEALAAARVIDAIERSCETGAWQEV